ncbi:MAG: DivIVA domain-containing protein, partial [Clostridia bacterium]|nr:DivIVA domain-containing protein [Clostridia bacterium]
KKKENMFNTKRKGYDCGQVDDYIAKMTCENTQVVEKQRERIDAMADEISVLKGEIAKYKSLEGQIKSSIISATEKQNEMLADIEFRYGAEMDRLEKFRAKWSIVYNDLKDRYNFSKDALNMESVAVSTRLEIEKILSNDFSVTKKSSVEEQQFKSESERLSSTNVAVNELKGKLIAAAEKKEEFSLYEATHPTESLEELCLSLGLIN